MLPVVLVLLANLAAVAVLMTVTALVARRVDRVAVVDVIWGLGFVLVALVSAVRRVFVVQGLAMWFVSLPVQVASVAGTRWSWLVWVGVAVWAVGLVFESVGDAQMSRYRAKPKDERPKVMDQGLWGWTRHPNYFGDSMVWWGIWLVGGLAAGLLPALTIVSPIVMTFFLIFATGARLLERTMMQREGYPEYAELTSFFFPLPPKKA